MNDFIPLKNLRDSEFKNIVCYPRFIEEDFNQRMNELESLGVKFFELGGKSRIGSFDVLGKGYSGVIVKVKMVDGKRYALKIRRIDSGKENMLHEVEMLKKANAVRVGVKLQNATKNFILIELVEDELLPQWVEKLRGRGKKLRLKKVLVETLRQCRVMDESGLDHGELSRATKHILIDKEDKPYLIDFEKASIQRRVSNVTSICQYLFIGSEVSKKIQKTIGKVNSQILVENLREYKEKPRHENFRNILKVLQL